MVELEFPLIPTAPICSTGPTSQSACQQQQHRSIILSKMAVAPVTSSRTHSHATQLFWILNIIIIVTIIALFYYPKTPKIWLLQKSKHHFWPLWPLAFVWKQKPITLEAMGDITNITITIQITKVVTMCFKILSFEMSHVTQVINNDDFPSKSDVFLVKWSEY